MLGGDVEMNPVQNGGVLAPGTVVGERYQVIDPIYFPIPSKTADFYRCQNSGQFFMLKLYRGKTTTNTGARLLLKRMSSPYVGKLHDNGSWNGVDFEVFSLYKNGSIHGKPLTIDYIKKGLVPCVNEGLHALHENGMKHRDVKPVHMMLFDDFSGAALVDCGDENGNALCGTTARSPEYGAPETFRGVFLEESDYFSFGVTLFELCCGYHPYQGVALTELAKSRDISIFPFPASVPNELKQLIVGLTYWDISNQKDLSCPDRRWGYEEVKNWCMGKSQATPGELAKIPFFEFLGEKYREIPLLVEAMVKHWEEGKVQVFQGYLTGFFKLYYPDYAGITKEAEAEFYKDKEQGDFAFWRLLYQLHPELSGFYWKQWHFSSLKEMGRGMVKALQQEDFSQEPLWNEILDFLVLSHFMQMTEGAFEHLVDGITALEISYSLEHSTHRQLMKHYHTMAFMLSEETPFYAFGRTFDHPTALQGYLGQLILSDYEKFEGFTLGMVDENNDLDPQLEAWLLVLGFDVKVDQWRGGLG